MFGKIPGGRGPCLRVPPAFRHGWRLLLCVVFGLLALAPHSSRGSGVTLITHGFDSDVTGWVTGMADEIPLYANFPGTNYTTYTITLTTDGDGNYFYQWTRNSGGAPALTDSGEIIVKLDWSQMAGSLDPLDFSVYDISTYIVASIASTVLLQTNAISDLGGHALAEYPLHLIGHSRGGSLISEMSRRLGTNGVWVDHLTTLDPHPLNNDGNDEESYAFWLDAVDASVENTSATVLYADDFWQDLGDNVTTPDGEPVAGAYVRQLTSLNGGYSGVGATHSDVHLWYHGTVELSTPASDTEATISNAQRQAWWTLDEARGTNAGFLFSLIGGGNRLSTNQPLGAGEPEIKDGFNQWWDLGAGITGNRAPAPTNNGTWPSLIRFDRMDSNAVALGGSFPVRLYYQWAAPAANNATLRVYLDNDWNPLNTNQIALWQTNLPGTGVGGSGLNAATFTIPLSANAAPGEHSLFAALSARGQTRHLYAPETIEVVPASQPPVLGIALLGTSRAQLGIGGLPGQTIILQASPDLVSWQPLATNTLSSTLWLYTNSPPAGVPCQFYRALLGPAPP